MRLVLLVLAVLISGCAGRNYTFEHEKDYQKYWCDKEGGKIEYRLNDMTRVDCLLPKYAVEVDWDYKWAEGVGQAQYYAKETGRKPGLLLITSKDGERYVRRAEISGKYSNLKIWTIEK